MYNCVVALNAVVKHHSEANLKLFLLTSSGLTPAQAAWLRKNNVEPIIIELKHYFSRGFAPYPRECYFHFAGPTIFHSRGFKVSLYIDGDLLSMRRSKIFSEIAPFLINHYMPLAARSACGCKYGYHRLSKRFGSHLVQERPQQRPHAAFLLYNNALLKHRKFLQHASRLFSLTLKAGVPRRGDDCLLALLHRARPKVIDTYYRFNPHMLALTPRDVHVNMPPAFYHFGHKPWKPTFRGIHREDRKRRRHWEKARSHVSAFV
jgi:hypothetical protein